MLEVANKVKVEVEVEVKIRWPSRDRLAYGKALLCTNGHWLV